MANRRPRNQPPPSAGAIATIQISSNARISKQDPASSVSSSSSSVNKGKRGRPKKSLIAAGDPSLLIIELHSGNSDSISNNKPEIPDSKNAKSELVKVLADCEQGLFSAGSNEDYAGDRSFNLMRNKSLRKGKPCRSPLC